jgi:hypothetical protein
MPPSARLVAALACLAMTSARASAIDLNAPPPNKTTLSDPDRHMNLAVRLEAVGVHDVGEMSVALDGLGLRTPSDLELLDDWAVAELDKELKEGGASLGDRAKLRIRGIGGGLITAYNSVQKNAAHLPAGHGGDGGALQPRRAQTDEGAAKADAEETEGLSADTLALVSTAVLGIATFVLQDRAAKNAAAAAKELEHTRVTL